MFHSAPLRKSKRINTDTGYLSTLSDVVKLLVTESLPTALDIQTKIEHLKMQGSLNVDSIDGANMPLSRPSKLKRSATDDYMTTKVHRSRFVVPIHLEQATKAQMSDHEPSNAIQTRVAKVCL